MNFEEKTIASEYIYRGRIMSLRKDKVTLPNGRASTREVVEHPGGVCVVPVTAEGDVLFVRQYRYPFREVMLELPAGKLDHGSEEPLEAGKRELREETGATAEKYVDLGAFYPSVGFMTEVLHLYLAQGLTFGAQDPDEDEFLEVVRLPLEEAVRMVMANELPDGKTQAGILKAYCLLQQNKAAK